MLQQGLFIQAGAKALAIEVVDVDVCGAHEVCFTNGYDGMVCPP
jgi:hypothetical protein